MEWVKNRNPTEQECEEAGDIGFILCVHGQYGNATYNHAIVLGDNFFEDGMWYVNARGGHDLTILGWMLPPTWDENDG